MGVAAIGAAVFCVLILGVIVIRRLRAKREIEAKSIEPEALFELLKAKRVLLYDVRQPLDFLAHPEIIPGATRIAPKDIAEQTASFSRDQNSVIYCTGGDDETSSMVLGKARAEFYSGEAAEGWACGVEGERVSGGGLFRTVPPGYGELAPHATPKPTSSFRLTLCS
jgi:hypothetical protein